MFLNTKPEEPRPGEEPRKIEKATLRMTETTRTNSKDVNRKSAGRDSYDEGWWRMLRLQTGSKHDNLMAKAGKMSGSRESGIGFVPPGIAGAYLAIRAECVQSTV